MEDVDFLARGLVDGSVPCDGCNELQKLIDQVRTGQMDFEEFKSILQTSKEQLLKQTV
jgi:hypothetical protein